MLKKLFVFLKRIIFAFLFLYAYNKFGISFNAFVPINIFTVILVSMFGLPGLFGLIIFKIIFF